MVCPDPRIDHRHRIVLFLLLAMELRCGGASFPDNRHYHSSAGSLPAAASVPGRPRANRAAAMGATVAQPPSVAAAGLKDKWATLTVLLMGLLLRPTRCAPTDTTPGTVEWGPTAQVCNISIRIYNGTWIQNPQNGHRCP